MNPGLQEKNELLWRFAQTMPGSKPYDSLRPINVPGRFDRGNLLDCLCEMHPHVSRDQWIRWFDAGHIMRRHQPVAPTQRVRGGEQYWHLFPDTVEPRVDPRVSILWEDESIVAVYKPAPLPTHPCGRFNMNSLTSFLRHVYDPDELRVVHRLDANTTGVMLLARSRDVATRLSVAFREGEVCKRYQVHCHGHPEKDCFECDDPISKERSLAGTRSSRENGVRARTKLDVIERFADGTSLLTALPISGRTNQIRIHLWARGMPVLGDPAYKKQGVVRATQTLRVDDPPMRLHACSLALKHPISAADLHFEAPHPDWLLALNEREKN